MSNQNRSLLDRINASGNRPKVAVFLGAGVSYGKVPLAVDIRLAYLRFFGFSASEAKAINDEYADILTLELLGSLFVFFSGLLAAEKGKEGAEAFIEELWHGLNSMADNVAERTGADLIVDLKKEGRIGTILTANFDSLVSAPLKKAGHIEPLDTRLADISLSEVDNLSQEQIAKHFFPIHGTTDTQGEKTTDAVTFTKPFSQKISRYLHRVLSEHDYLLFLGCSGYDYYDVNPFLKGLPRSKQGKSASTPQLGDKVLWLAHTNSKQGSRPDKTHPAASFILEGNLYWENTNRFLEDWLNEGPQNFCQGFPGDLCVFDAFTNAAAASSHGHQEFHRNLAQIKARLKDAIEQKLHVAWTVADHYRLFSLGYNEDITESFAGVAAGESQPITKTLFSELDLSRFIKLHSEYRAVQKKGNDETYDLIAGMKECAETAYQLIDQVKIRIASDTKNAAILSLFCGIFYDYLGLCYKHIYGRSVRQNSASGMKYRFKAIAYFWECVHYAQQAIELDTNSSSPLLDKQNRAYCPIDPHTWIAVGYDNIGEMYSVGHCETQSGFEPEDAPDVNRAEAELAYETLVTSANIRIGLMKSTSMPEVRNSHAPQLWRRLNFIAKALLTLSEAWNLNQLTEQQTQKVNTLSELVEYGLETYQNYVDDFSPTLNFRYTFLIAAMAMLYVVQKSAVPKTAKLKQGSEEIPLTNLQEMQQFMYRMLCESYGSNTPPTSMSEKFFLKLAGAKRNDRDLYELHQSFIDPNSRALETHAYICGLMQTTKS